MINVLIVDDEVEIQNVLSEYLKYNGLNPIVACDGCKALEIVSKTKIDIILMDIMMPNMDGYTATSEIKKLKNIPIIMMSAKSEEYDKLKGFDLGIEDYIIKPFSLKETLARIKTVLRRSLGYFDVLEIDKIRVNVEARKVFVSEEPIELTNKEFELLLTLMQNKNAVLSRERLLNEVWGLDYDGDGRTIDAHIKMLRALLKDAAKYIKTIHGVGYKFEA